MEFQEDRKAQQAYIIVLLHLLRQHLHMEATETTTGKSKYMITAWYGVGGLNAEPRKY